MPINKILHESYNKSNLLLILTPSLILFHIDVRNRKYHFICFIRWCGGVVRSCVGQSCIKSSLHNIYTSYAHLFIGLVCVCIGALTTVLLVFMNY